VKKTSFRKTKVFVSLLLLIFLGFFLWLQPRNAAEETLFFGGTILTLEPGPSTGPTPEALLMRGDRIIAVGPLKAVRAAATGSPEEINLAGKTLMPGLIEPHSHPLATALLGEAIDVSGFTNNSRAQIMTRLKDGIENTPSSRWALAFGWDPVMMDDLHAPTLAELDALSPDKPLLILTQMMHDAYANSAALAAAGITQATPNPLGAEFVKGPNGKLTGTVREVAAIAVMFAAMPAPPESAPEFLLARQYQKFARAGYTTVGIVGPVGRATDLIATMQYIATQPDTAIRTLIYALPPQLENGPNAIAGGPQNHTVPGGVIGVKFWMDGSPFAGGAAFAEPYEDSALVRNRLHLGPGHMSTLNYTEQEFEAAYRKFHALGYQIAVHVQGERAVEQVLDVAERILAENPRADHRHRLEHNALITKAQLQRALRLGITTSFFVDHVYFYGHALPDLVGTVRTARYMPVRTALTMGHKITVHTDNPSSPIGAMRVMQTLRARKARASGTVIGPDQRLSPTQALEAMTINAAWQLGIEKEAGSLKPGKSADLLILSANPLETTDEQLRSLKVIGTWIKGQPADTRPLTPTIFKTGFSLMLDMVFG